jgi:hypothetical protein
MYLIIVFNDKSKEIQHDLIFLLSILINHHILKYLQSLFNYQALKNQKVLIVLLYSFLDFHKNKYSYFKKKNNLKSNQLIIKDF